MTPLSLDFLDTEIVEEEVEFIEDNRKASGCLGWLGIEAGRDSLSYLFTKLHQTTFNSLLKTP